VQRKVLIAMAKNLSPADIADKQIKAARDHAADFRSGVLATKKSPIQRALAKKQKMLDNFTESINDGTWEANLGAVTDQQWKDITSTKGGDNYAKGVEKSRDKILAFQTQRKSFQEQLSNTIDSMPNDTEEQREERLLAQTRGMRQFRFRRRKS
jgi:hypothetical protein